MAKKVEMIISYTVEGEDFQYNDNHGLLIRCADCKFFNLYYDPPRCDLHDSLYEMPYPDGYCSNAEKR